MIWTDESHIICGDQIPATKPTREAKLAILVICILVAWIMLSVGALVAEAGLA